MVKSTEIFIFLLLILVIYISYTKLINKNTLEGFINIVEQKDKEDSATGFVTLEGEITEKKKEGEFPETIVEKRIEAIYGSSLRMTCNLNLSKNVNDCIIDNKQFVKYLFPTHLLQLPNNKILATFNDGRLYMKDTLLSNMWKGPLKNSIPYDSIPLRMVTINYRDNSLLGVGYDNKLYAKQADSIGNLNILGEWVSVPNNQGIIYVITDLQTKRLICIDIFGKLYIKKSNDLTDDLEPVGDINVPLLKLFYDSNGYMLALDSNFNLVQFEKKKWKQSQLNYKKGINKMKVFDILYDHDGKLFGLVFVPGVGLLELMKQQTVYFISEFVPLEFHTKYSLESGNNFLLNDIKIIEAKTGINIIEDNDDFGSEENKEDDITYAYMKSIVQNKTKLREFCKNRGIGNAYKFENYDMLNSVENQEIKINELKDVISSLLQYEPEKHKIQEEILLNKN